MDHFGLKTPRDLPQLKDLHSFENTINPEESMVGAAEPISNEEIAALESMETNTADDALDAMIAQEFNDETLADDMDLSPENMEEIIAEESDNDVDGFDEEDINTDNNEEDESSEK